MSLDHRKTLQSRAGLGIALLVLWVLAAVACLPDMGQHPPDPPEQDTSVAIDTRLDTQVPTDGVDDEDSSTTLPDFGVDTSSAPSPTWDSFARDFFAVYCQGCHQTPPKNNAPMSLETYELVLIKLPNIMDRAVIKQDMPPRPPFPQQPELLDLAAWIDAGAPRN